MIKQVTESTMRASALSSIPKCFRAIPNSSDMLLPNKLGSSGIQRDVQSFGQKSLIGNRNKQTKQKSTIKEDFIIYFLWFTKAHTNSISSLDLQKQQQNSNTTTTTTTTTNIPRVAWWQNPNFRSFGQCSHYEINIYCLSSSIFYNSVSKRWNCFFFNLKK